MDTLVDVVSVPHRNLYVFESLENPVDLKSKNNFRIQTCEARFA